MITCTAIQLVKPGKEKELEQLMNKLSVQIHENESGCVLFQYSRSDKNRNEYLVVEQYIDQNALDFHHQTDYLKEFIPKMMLCLEQAPIVKQYENIFPKEPPIAPFFHIGIVVENLEKAVELYSKVLGLTFTKPAKFHVPQFIAHDCNPEPIDIIAVYSEQGPPYYELIQATGEGLLSIKNTNQILYAGVWESNIKNRIKLLKENNIDIDAVLADSQGEPFVVFSGKGLGIRIEFVGDGSKPLIEKWVETGEFIGKVAK